MPTRIPTKPLRAYPWYLRPFFWSQRRHYGRVLVPGLLWGRVPRVFMAVAVLYGVLERWRSRIDPVLRALVTVRVSQLNWCRFCVDINSATLARRTGSMDKVRALQRWRDSELFDARERIVLDYAEAMTCSERHVTDEIVERLREHFDDDAMVELTALIAFQNMSSKFNSALDVEPQGFCSLPPGAQSGARGSHAGGAAGSAPETVEPLVRNGTADR